MSANFNNAAWFYDRLSRVVYGRALIDAQVYLLQFIPADSNVLIIGGGTGLILEKIAEVHPSGLSIIYIDVAAGMISRAKKRNAGKNKITFVNDTIENTKLSAAFDVIITPFLLDNFTEQNLSSIFTQVHHLLKSNGLWLNTSFQLSGKWWQPVLLKTMFIFFRLLCNIEAKELPAIEKQFGLHGYRVLAGQTFYEKFIVSTVYKV
jgi:ubiquinone/menaquinone biosynthesis C-methylase UbiE